MPRSLACLALTVLLFAAGCASQAEFLNNNQSNATQTAVARAQFEMNCQQVTPSLFREKSSSPSWRALGQWDPTG